MSLVAANRGLSPRGALRGASNRPVEASRSRVNLPDPMDLAHWRQSAEARMEDALTDLDHRLLMGEDLEYAQRQVVDTYMLWTRRSVEPFADARVCYSDDLMPEIAHWERVADRAIAVESPEQVERFLRIWLAVIHEAAASGRASLYALPSG